MSPSPTKPTLTIPWFRPVDEADLRSTTLEAWSRILDHGQFVGGSEVEAFERLFGESIGRPCAGVSSGTAALRLLLQAFRIGPGDEVLLPAQSFIATAEAVIHTGAKPVFAEVDEQTGSLDPAACARSIGPRCRAIVAVHLFGRVAAMHELAELAKAHDLVLIEDAAQAHGATYRGRSAGALGDGAAFSFHPTKNLAACGDAGAVVARDDELITHIRALRNHGQSSPQLHAEVGETARLHSLQAAALSLRLERLARWNRCRDEIARQYRERLESATLRLPTLAPAGEDVHHLFVVRHPRRDALREHLASDGIGTAVHYPVPLHLQPALRESRLGAGSFPIAESWADSCLTLPLYPGLGSAEIARVCDSILDFCGISER